MNDLMVIENKKTKERSPTFPFISLAYAIERAKRFFAEEKRGSAFMPIAARHWGYSPSSSGVLQTVSALKSYGLLIDEGNGENRKVRLTDAALRIILDERPESTERERYIRQAALMPTIAAEIYKNWPDALPSNATLIHWLVLEKKFSQEAALKAAKIIRENQALAKIDEFYNESSSGKMEADNEFEPGYEVQASAESAGSERSIIGSLPRPRFAGGGVAYPISELTGKQVGSAIPVTKNCSMSIIADGEVTQEGLDKLVAYIQLIKGSFPEKEEQQQ